VTRDVVVDGVPVIPCGATVCGTIVAAKQAGRLVKEQFGSAQLARQFVLKHSNNNGKRVLDSLAKSAPKTSPVLDREQIVESYRASTLAQTVPSGSAGVHLSPTYERTREIA
jgi:hypothetical protein